MFLLKKEQRKSAKKPLSICKTSRMQWCEKLLNDDDLRSKLVFTDEKMFSPDSHSKMDFVKRLPNERFEEKNIFRPRRGNSNASVMIWMYIGEFGKGEIFLAENVDRFNPDGSPISGPPPNTNKGFDNHSYVEMLKNHGIRSINSKTMDFVFVQDNSPVHTSLKNTGNTVFDLFRQNGIEHLNTPANSPDLHPIELAFSVLQREYYKEIDRLKILSKNKKQTFEIVKRVWNDKVENEEIKKVYWSITTKCLKCLKNNGNNNFKG